jgi:hypothetical protein
VVGGGICSASGTGSISLGGYQNNATGIYAVVVGGQLNQASAEFAVSMGCFGRSFRMGQLAHGVGSNNGPAFGYPAGPAQYSRYSVYGQAISGFITLADGGSNPLVLETGKTYAIKATCIANRVGVAGRAMFVDNMLVHCTSGGIAVIDQGPTRSINFVNGTGWTLTYTVTGVDANVQATFGVGGGQTVNALVTYEWSEVGGGV